MRGRRDGGGLEELGLGHVRPDGVNKVSYFLETGEWITFCVNRGDTPIQGWTSPASLSVAAVLPTDFVRYLDERGLPDFWVGVIEGDRRPACDTQGYLFRQAGGIYDASENSYMPERGGGVIIFTIHRVRVPTEITTSGGVR